MHPRFAGVVAWPICLRGLLALAPIVAVASWTGQTIYLATTLVGVTGLIVVERVSRSEVLLVLHGLVTAGLFLSFLAALHFSGNIRASVCCVRLRQRRDRPLWRASDRARQLYLYPVALPRLRDRLATSILRTRGGCGGAVAGLAAGSRIGGHIRGDRLSAGHRFNAPAADRFRRASARASSSCCKNGTACALPLVAVLAAASFCHSALPWDGCCPPAAIRTRCWRC